MKKSYGFYSIFSALIMLMFIFASCTKEGPAGKDGTDGTNGAPGADGADGTAGCVQCHDADMTITVKQFQWERSRHARGTALSRASSPSCSPCHSQQGFLISDGNNIDKQDQWQGISDPVVLNCYTCHPIHTTYTKADVETKRFQEQPIWQVTYGKTVDMDLGVANLCTHCHQSRVRNPIVDMNDLSAMYGEDPTISSHYGPHYSAQANLYGSFGAYEFEGSSSYANENYHLGAEKACVTCHMGFSTSSQHGGHTWIIDHEDDLELACAQCHDGGAGAPGKYETYYHDYFATIDHDGENPTVNTTSYYSMLGDALTAHGVYTKVVDSVDGYPDAVHYNINSGLKINGTLLAAMFNHRFLYQDHSHGIHNPWYARALLKNSLEAVEALN